MCVRVCVCVCVCARARVYVCVQVTRKRSEPEPEDNEPTQPMTTRGKKAKQGDTCLLEPIEDGHSAWEDRLCDLLFPEWSPAKQLKLREWLQHGKLTEMVQTLDAVPSAPDVRNGILKSILRGTGAPPELFKQIS